jgi:hypothetical protein
MYETAGLITGVRPSGPLAETLRRAAAFAQQRAHRFVTLEHLLLALLDDPDANAVLCGVNANIPAARTIAGDIVVRQLANLQASGPYELRPHPQLERILQVASRDAGRSPSGEIDGAFVIAALTGEGDSMAADVLRQHGLGFQQAMAWLNAHRGGVPQPLAPQAQPAPRAAPRQSIAAPVASNGVAASAHSIIDFEEGSPMVTHLERRFNGMADVSDTRQPPRRRSELQERLRQVRANGAAAALPDLDESEPIRQAAPMKRQAGAAPASLLAKFPRRLHLGKPETIEINISREEIAGLFQDTGDETVITRAVSVILHSTAGGITVETLAPQTQWLFDRPSFMETERFGRWRWRLTPKDAGKHKLQLIVNGRSLDLHGVAGDTALPNQAVEIRVKRNLMRGFKTLAVWLILMAMGGALTMAAPMMTPVLKKVQVALHR